MSGKTSFVHITDLHISAPELNDQGLKSDTTQTLRQVRTMIEALDPQPAFVIASGDLTNRGDAASFRALAALFEGFGPPVIWALGNHDTRAGFYAGLLGRTDAGDAPYDHHRVIAGVQIITLDTSRPRRIGGDLSDAQFAFLEEALASQDAALPRLIVMHHAPALDFHPDWEWESLSFAATERLARVLAGKRVDGIFSGHIHMDRFSQWHGIPLVVGMGLHAALDPLHPGKDSIRAVQGTSFSVCTLRDSGLTVTCAPLPATRDEVGLLTLEMLRAYEAGLAETAVA